MEKIAIYGGSFDPPHEGHKLLAQNLAEYCGAQKVLVIPTAMSPFKNTSGASSSQRYEMCKLAFNDPLFEVSDIEISRGGKSYTVDTVNKVKELYPESDLYLFMGDDMFLSFNKWYKYEEIMRMCKLVAACRTRNLEELQNMKKFAREVLHSGEDRVLFCESVPVEISSTTIRENIKNDCFDYIDINVQEYIKAKGLYL